MEEERITFRHVAPRIAVLALRAAEICWRGVFGSDAFPCMDPFQRLRLNGHFAYTINVIRWWLRSGSAYFGTLDSQPTHRELEVRWRDTPLDYWRLFVRPLPNAQRRYLLVMDLIRCLALVGELPYNRTPRRNQGAAVNLSDLSKDDVDAMQVFKWQRAGTAVNGSNISEREEWYRLLHSLGKLTSDCVRQSESRRETQQVSRLRELHGLFEDWLIDGRFKFEGGGDPQNIMTERFLAESRWETLQTYKTLTDECLLDQLENQNRLYVLTVALMWQTLDEWLRDEIATLARASRTLRTSEVLAVGGDSLENQGFAEDSLAIENRMFQPDWYVNEVYDPARWADRYSGDEE